MYYTVSFNAFKNAIGQSGGFAVIRVLKSYSTWIMCQSNSVSSHCRFGGAATFCGFWRISCPTFLKITYII